MTMTDFPLRIGGEVVIASERAETMYNSFKFAAARRVERTIYLWGVIAGPLRGEGRDVEAFKAQLRRAFADIGATLEAAGAGFAHVAMINTFHEGIRRQVVVSPPPNTHPRERGGPKRPSDVRAAKRGA
jgi:enamine deaminase RidA (YjgF/YER057c/UK114 family)